VLNAGRPVFESPSTPGAAHTSNGARRQPETQTGRSDDTARRKTDCDSRAIVRQVRERPQEPQPGQSSQHEPRYRLACETTLPAGTRHRPTALSLCRRSRGLTTSDADCSHSSLKRKSRWSAGGAFREGDGVAEAFELGDEAKLAYLGPVGDFASLLRSAR
jgi:hypothetical protein